MNNSYIIIKKGILIALCALLFTCCNFFSNHRKNGNLSNENVQSYFPKLATNKNLNMKGDADTLIMKIDGIDYNIFPNGLLSLGSSKTDTIRLTTDMFVEKAFFFKIDSSLFLFCEESDNDCGSSEVFNINLLEKRLKWKAQIYAFNLGQPIIRGDFVYLTTLGFVGKLDLKSGKYAYKYSELYDNQKYAFNNFDTIIFKDTMTYFLSKRSLAEIFDSIIVNEKNNKMVIKKTITRK